jgi:hypothetical protein
VSSSQVGQSRADTRWLDVDPRSLARTEFGGHLTTLFFIGFGVFAWISISLSNPFPGTIRWVHLSHDAAYLWVTASSVLILALAASSSLTIDRAPAFGEERLDRLLSDYDAARIDITRSLMRFGSNAGAGFGIFVTCAGAQSYLLEVSASESPSASDWESAITGACTLTVLGLFLIFASSTVGNTLWGVPKGLQTPRIDKYDAKSIAAALELCGYEANDLVQSPRPRNRVGYIKRYSLEILALTVPLIGVPVYVGISVVFYHLNGSLAEFSRFGRGFLVAYFYFVLFLVPAVACWCSGHATRIMARTIASNNKRSHVGYLWLSYLWYAAFVAACVVTFIVYPTTTFSPV